MKLLYLGLSITEFIPKSLIGIGSGNGFTLNKWQNITGTNVD